MDASLKHWRLSQTPRVVIELQMKEAELIVSGNKNLTNVMNDEIKKALKTAKYLAENKS